MHILRKLLPVVFFVCAIGYTLIGKVDRGALFLILAYVADIDNAVQDE
jgi:hypothetical protein